MQNRYVGDVADFGKHGLLRFLSGTTDEAAPQPKLKLGVVWYMHHDEKHPPADNIKISGDGDHIEYITRIPGDDRSNFRNIDPELWEKLRDLVFRGARCVHCAEGAGLLPEDTEYFNALLHFSPPMTRSVRREIRRSWLNAAHQRTANADIVCLDPDNGIAREDKMYRKEGPKHTYISDLKEFWNDGDGKSLVVYQHTGRTGGSAEDQIKAKANTLRDELRAGVISLHFRAGSSRAFYVIPQPKHEELIKQRVGRLLGGAWGEHFEWVW